jgi:hypothetical protein
MSTKRNNNFSNESIHGNIYGLASTLLIVVNSNWKSDFVVIYAIPYKALKAGESLKSMLFGRECTNNAFKADKMCIINLNRFYSNYLIDFVTTTDKLQEIATKNNCNLGYAAEIALENSGFFKKASAKYDRKCVYLIGTKDNKLYQVKCSIVKSNSHGSAGTTNKRAHK